MFSTSVHTFSWAGETCTSNTLSFPSQIIRIHFPRRRYSTYTLPNAWWSKCSTASDKTEMFQGWTEFRECTLMERGHLGPVWPTPIDLRGYPLSLREKSANLPRHRQRFGTSTGGQRDPRPAAALDNEITAASTRPAPGKGRHPRVLGILRVPWTSTLTTMRRRPCGPRWPTRWRGRCAGCPAIRRAPTGRGARRARRSRMRARRLRAWWARARRRSCSRRGGPRGMSWRFAG